MYTSTELHMFMFTPTSSCINLHVHTYSLTHSCHTVEPEQCVMCMCMCSVSTLHDTYIDYYTSFNVPKTSLCCFGGHCNRQGTYVRCDYTRVTLTSVDAVTYTSHLYSALEVDNRVSVPPSQVQCPELTAR